MTLVGIINSNDINNSNSSEDNVDNSNNNTINSNSSNDNSDLSTGEQYLRSLTKTFMGIEKPLKNEKTVATLNELVAELHRVFASDRVNIEYVNHLLLSYKSNPVEWKKFAKFDRYK